MRRPRFSLLTMVLFVLLVGSTVTLVLHWPAWRVSARMISRVSVLGTTTDSKLILMRDDQTNQFALFDLKCRPVYQFQDNLDSFFAKFSKDGLSVEFWPRRDSPEFARRWSISAREWVPWKRYTAGDIEELSKGGQWVLSRPQEDYPSTQLFRLFDVKSGRELKQWKRYHDEVRDVIFDRFLRGTECIWVIYADRCERFELPELRCVQTFPFRISCAFSPDGRWVAHMSPDTPDVFIRDANSGIIKSELKVPPANTGVHLSYSNGGEILCIADYKGSFAHLWHLKTFEIIDLDMSGAPGEFTRMHFNKNDDKVCTLTEPRETLWIWDSTSGRLLYQDWFESVDLASTPLLLIDKNFNLIAPPSQKPITTFEDYKKVQLFPDLEHVYAEPRMGDSQFHILTRHRPEAWWGIAWLPEFWLTVVFAGLFFWNLVRPRFSR